MSRTGNPVRALVEQRAADSPNRTAYVEGATGDTLTWAQIWDGVEGWDRLAAGTGARVGLVAANPLSLVAGYLGGLAAGVLIAPLDPMAAPSELAGQVAGLGLTAVASDGDSADLVNDISTVSRWRLAPSGPELAAGGAAPRPAIAGLSAAMILPSSGTTGPPKIIPLGAEQLVETALAVADVHQLGADDTGYSPLPLFHINGLVVGVLATLVSGGRLVVDRRFSASRFWSTIETQQVTWLNLVPAIISILSERPGPAAEVTDRIGFARSASAPLPAVVREAFEARTGVGVVETYGMTEAASQIAANPRDPTRRRPGSVGLPVAVDLRVVDRSSHPVPPGQVGQVEIRGRRVVSRYWSSSNTAAGDSGLSASRPACGPDGWLATGDLGWLDAEGYVFLAGRIDDVINRGGEKVFPREVEDVLLADPDVTSAAVVGRPDPVVGEEPIAFVIPATGADIDRLSARLAERCAARLSRFKRPAQIIVAERLPAGPTGKIRHAELRRSVAASATRTPAGDLPDPA
jgi:acyl-CoA synthetase (AMP-forming)/AMP-acid ligase II